MLQTILIYLLLPVSAVIIGGTLATIWSLSPQVQSYIQHFAAGVVFAAVAGEIIPAIMHERSPIAVVIGFTLGVASLLALRYVLGRWEQQRGEGNAAPLTLVVVVGIDLLIDGLLVGVGFAAGMESGVLLTIALTIEILFLVLSTVAAQSRAGASRRTILLVIGVLALLVTGGAVVGVTLLIGLTGAALEVVLSFGAAALLYLVTEELLVEAHEVPETPLATAAFFAGFLVLFIIEMAGG